MLLRAGSFDPAFLQQLSDRVTARWEWLGKRQLAAGCQFRERAALEVVGKVASNSKRMPHLSHHASNGAGVFALGVLLVGEVESANDGRSD
jgi:hypothetical protein